MVPARLRTGKWMSSIWMPAIVRQSRWLPAQPLIPPVLLALLAVVCTSMVPITKKRLLVRVMDASPPPPLPCVRKASPRVPVNTVRVPHFQRITTVSRAATKKYTSLLRMPARLKRRVFSFSRRTPMVSMRPVN